MMFAGICACKHSVYIYMHASMMSADMFTDNHILISTHIYRIMHLSMFVHIYIYMYIHVCVYPYICVCAYVYMYM